MNQQIYHEKLTPEQLERVMRQDQSFTLINDLGQDAFNQQHIPGSINVPLGQPYFIQQVNHEACNKDVQIIVYRASRDCPASEKVRSKLEEAGYKNAYDYKEAIAG